MSTYRGGSSALYRPSSYTPTTSRAPVVTDDYERWYTEASPSNRMVLSIMSGMDNEIGWALDRLCRLCHNEQWSLRQTPGQLEALFEWPEWFATKGYKESTDLQSLFSVSQVLLRRRQHALESLFVLRNAALQENNSNELARYPRTMPFILNALHNLNLHLDENNEFLLHTVELFHSVAGDFVLPPKTSPQSQNPLPPFLRLTESPNRSMIIATLVALTLLFSNSQNTSHLSSDSPALTAAIRYLPLFVDKPLLDASLNYLYVHLSNNAMAKSFLLHPDMPSVLRILVSLLIHEQIEETVTVDVTGVINTVPATVVSVRDHDITQTELESLVDMPEPQRCYEWIKYMFTPKPDGEVTQVDFWTLYKDTFMPYGDRGVGILAASDVIKNVSLVYTQAQAMVLPGPPQRFIVRGIDRRKDVVVTDRLKCQWGRSHCPVPAFTTPQALLEHWNHHLQEIETDEVDCLWSTCPQKGLSKSALSSHILTHFWSPQQPERHPSQSDTITLSSIEAFYPDKDPTSRPPPLPRSTVLQYKRPVADPPSSSLTALLCIRILFRTSFVSAEEAPRVDADHFGFPGIVEDVDEDNAMDYTDEGGSEAARKGRKAFAAVSQLMENVQIKDETLMGWIIEMIEESQPQLQPEESPS